MSARWRPWFAIGCGLFASCTASADDVRPPPNQLFFPTGLAISPDERTLFAVNANSELRYDSGSISVIELDRVQQVIKDWTMSGVVSDGCAIDRDHRETLVCDEAEAGFIKTDTGVRIGNFATDIAIQDFTAGGGSNLRVIVPTRGDPSISWADFDGSRLSCTSASEGYALCDDAHRLTSVRENPDLPPIPGEPFGVFADGPNGFAVVTHLSLGAVTLIASAPGGDAQVVDVKTNQFAPDLLGTRAATGIAGVHPNGDNEVIYVGSRTEDRIQTFTVGAIDKVAVDGTVEHLISYLLPSNSFFLDAVGANSGGSADTRGMQFSPSSQRLYLVNRNPPTLQIIDTSPGPGGFPRNVAVGASDICRQGSTVGVTDSGDGERAYVTCFQDGQIYVVDPVGQSHVEDIISVGRGPYAVVAAHGANSMADTRRQLFVSNFLEDTIAVIDVTPNSPTRNRVVLRIGRPRAL
jgi:hypothetical protein